MSPNIVGEPVSRMHGSDFTASVEGTVGSALELLWIVEFPQSVRQEIREARKPFPLR